MPCVLVTRAETDAEKTLSALRAQGFEALGAPVLQLELLPQADLSGTFGGVVITSANAIRAIARMPDHIALIHLPLYAVGERSAALARLSGFAQAMEAGLDARALADFIRRHDSGALPLLYLAGADLSFDLESDLKHASITIETRVVYRMAPVTQWADDIVAAIKANAPQAVLHYSARSARQFATLAAQHDLMPQLTRALQVCLSDQVAEPLRQAGFARIKVASQPQEEALIAALRGAV